MNDTSLAAAATVACPHCHTTNRVGAGEPAQAHCGECGRPLFEGHPVELDGSSFARHLKAGTPLVVDFWAPWCGPCRMAAPILEQLGRANPGTLAVLKVNTDQHPAPSRALGIQGIPTFLVFRGGREVARQAGVLPRPQFEAWVQRHALA